MQVNNCFAIKRCVLPVFLFIIFQNVLWADDFEISLLTISPGRELYAAFGHSALRVRNITSGSDLVYNYGLFDYSEPGFYLNFIRGRMNYRLAAGSYAEFFYTYSIQGRGVIEQIFEMDSGQKQFTASFLENNAKPENSYYRYHYFYDNCSTRIRDLVLLAYPGIEFPAAETNPSYRELLHSYLRYRPWERLGIDLILGIPGDKKTGARMQMFLPDYLSAFFSRTEYRGRPIVGETETVIPVPEVKRPFIISPWIIMAGIFLLSLCFCIRRKYARIFDFLLFFSAGILGTVIALLWFCTEHTDMRNNFNIIWAFPGHLIMAFFIPAGKRNRFYRGYFLAALLVSGIFLASWPLNPQGLNPALLPFIAAIALRAYMIYSGGSFPWMKKYHR